PAMSTVPGVDLFFFGPADFSASAGFRGQWEGPGVAEEIVRLKDLLRSAGKHCGVVATSDTNIRQRIEQGFRMIGLGMDAGLLIRSLKTSLSAVGRDRLMRADLTALQSTPHAPREEGAARTGSLFHVALTGDFFDGNGKLRYRDIGLGLF